MPEKRTTKSSASTRAKRGSASNESSDKKAGAKRSPSSQAAGATTRKKTARKKAAGTIVDKTTEVLGEMLTGAAVGAVTGAAERVGDLPTAVHDQPDAPERAMAAGSKKEAGSKASPRKRGNGKKSGEVLGEMLSGAAVGAVTGAAKAVMPAKAEKGKGRARSK